MDKEWVFLDHDSDEYKEGLQAFINRSLQFSSFSNKISCPCSKCRNRWPMLVQEVEDHIYVDGFDPDYVNLPWVEHGEQLPELPALNVARPFEPHQPISVGDIPDMLQDAFGLHDNEHVPEIEVEDLANHDSIPTPDAAKFYKLMSEADMELFPGARKKKIDFLIRYYQLKVLHGWSDVSFTESLKLLKESFPEGENLPDSFYKTKQLVKDLGLSYEKIDACPKDCMLYWKEHSEATSCCICGTSRYIKGAAEDGASAKKIAAKVLRYFPLGPRLQRLYMSRHTAESMIWHSTKRPRDGFLRHPADSLAWSKVDELYPNFGNESRNVRLGLASDGFNPFGNMSTSHSTWPVVMSVYNLPPWMCMKQPYMMLSLLIPGPKGPGNDIDVYLQPLVEELKNLWNEGIHTYDAFTKSTFTMRAAVLWTISDFPAYAMLSGYSTKGYKACPVCMEETDSIRLHHGNKECFMGHRRWLPIEHKYRRWRNSFNGLPEHRGRPTVMSGTDCLRALSGLRFQFGKGKIPAGVRKRSRSSTLQQEPVKGNWRKKSIFFDLPYWEHLLLRHNLDVMHIEKNVTDSVVGTLLGMKWKNKDSAKAREDMVLLNVKKGLHPISPGGRYPPAIFNLKNMEKTTICKVLHSIHPPDGFCSNISNCVRVEERTLVGLKSHDNHILMQHLLPVAIRRAISCKVLTTVLLELSSFFRQLCTKVGSADYYANLSRQIALALCTLEAIMPPAFFDVMEHLPIHLADEAAIAGPVQYRWMYPIERYLFTLKKYVRNKNLPEGCIAEGYIIEECLSFCVMYLSDGIDSKRTRIGRNADDPNNVPRLGLPVFDKKGRALEKPHEFKLTKEDLLRAHTHVLINCPEIKSYLKEHVEREKTKRGRRSCQDSERLANLSFAAYFKNLIETKVRNGDRGIDPDVRALAAGPDETVGRYKKYVINGFRFHVKSLDTGSNAQNSGIFVNAGSNCYATADDHRPRDGMLDYYGILTDIIELDYHSGRKVLLFDGDWIDNRTANRGLKKDEYGFLLANFNYLLPKPDTLVFASQTLQVFYVKCPVELDWDVIVRTRPRDYFDMGADLSPEPYAPQELHNGDDDGEDVTVPRTDMPDIALD